MTTIITITYDNAYKLTFKTTTQHMMHWIDEAKRALTNARIKTDKWEITDYQTL